MKDPWYGHRDMFFDEYSDKDEWIKWDYALAEALQVIEDMTDGNGIPVWVSDSANVIVDAKKRTNKFQESIDRKTKGTDKNPYKPDPGEVWVPEVSVRGKAPRPTYREYLESARTGGASAEENWGSQQFGPSWDEMQDG